MKITALEEHLMTPAIVEAWKTAPDEARDQYATFNSRGVLGERLLDVGLRRISDMDDQGIDVQVLSVTTPGVQNLSAKEAVPLAREANDAIAAAVRAHPDRFEGFATLPTPDPEAAAAELRRAVTELGFMGAMVHGRTGSKNADDAIHEPVWRAASELRAPIYLHPQMPVIPVRDAYYADLDPFASFALGGPGIGWHYEAGIQAIRMILGGVFDRNPGLQVVLGHWGEVVLFYTERIEKLQDWANLGLKKPILEYFKENLSFTGSGDLSDRYLAWTKDVVGTDRILYATDYPFIDTDKGRARAFLESADLTEAEKSAVGARNWERLTAHLR
ncbi:amidohydrolase family protein [Frondihabitans cladoniiphilus]|uniref:Amidohydrolase family protein n=1 Tax=Frondihabitans cladoniiphilus TaxID=715785 RepID=A0ABP8W6Q5_9MICO